MIRRLFRIGMWLGLLAGIAFALAKLLESQRQDAPAALGAREPWPRLESDPAVAAAPVARAVADPSAPVATPAAKAWVEPAGGACPSSHPVKGKIASKIFHLPGMANYERTKPDRCYLDASAAEADGLRPAKR